VESKQCSGCPGTGQSPGPKNTRRTPTPLTATTIVALVAAYFAFQSARSLIWPVSPLEQMPAIIFGSLSALVLLLELISIIFQSRLTIFLVVCILGILLVPIVGNLIRSGEHLTTTISLALLLMDVYLLTSHAHWWRKLRS
jgi:hypothetical protein